MRFSFGVLLCAMLLPWLSGAKEVRRPELNQELINRYADSMVDVEFHFRYDETGNRSWLKISTYCPNCGEYHSNGISSLTDEGIPAVVPGFVVGENKVICAELPIRPEWVEKIMVRTADGRSYPASLTAFFPDQGGMELTLDEKLDGKIRPLEFVEGEKGGRRYGFFIVGEEGIRTAGIRPESREIRHDFRLGRNFLPGMPNTLLINDRGEALTISLQEKLPVDGLPTAPSAWRRVAVADREAELNAYVAFIRENVLPVRIRLRGEAAQPSRYEQIMMSMDYKSNEVDALGLVLSDGRVLALAELEPARTARLERAVVVLPDGREVECAFVGSLRNWGALVLKPAEKLPGSGIELFRQPPMEVRDERLIGVVAQNYDGRLSMELMPLMLSGFSREFSNQVLPQASDYYEENMMLFTPDRKLLVLPLTRRWSEMYDRGWRALGADRVAQLLDSGEKGLEPWNVPLDAKASPQYAWSGLEFQELTTELAKVHRASEFLNGMSRGLMVSRVFPGSPAEQAGIRPGDVLLFMRQESSPVRINLDSSMMMMSDMMEDFPWEQYDFIPEQLIDELPPPWLRSDGVFNRQLTLLGVGGKVIFGMVRDGKFSEKAVVLGAAPPTYADAPRYNAGKFGLTVAEMTPEVRDYFHFDASAPGVVISRVMPGGPASVAGVKPYELITAVDNEPVMNIEGFKAAIRDKRELNLTVRRLNTSRAVILRSGSAGAAGENESR